MLLDTYLKIDEYGNIIAMTQIPKLDQKSYIIPEEGLVYYPQVVEVITLKEYYVNSSNQVIKYTEPELQEKNKFQQNSYLRWNAQEKVWVDSRTEIEKLTAEWDLVKAKRNKLLSESDWVVIRAADQNQAVPSNWQLYRENLRNITKQQDPFNIVWPPKPE